MFKRILLLKHIPLNLDLGRLCLRLIAFVPMFLKHGTEKVFGFQAAIQHYQVGNIDPLHIGLLPTLLIATFSDAICSLLMIFGLATRWAALFSFCNLFVVWVFIDHFVTVRRGLTAGEPVVLYMAACVTLFFIGAGKFSIDGLIERAPEKEAQQGHASMAQA